MKRDWLRIAAPSIVGLLVGIASTFATLEVMSFRLESLEGKVEKLANNFLAHEKEPGHPVALERIEGLKEK